MFEFEFDEVTVRSLQALPVKLIATEMLKITDVYVKNYRSLFEFKLDFQPLTILIGRNDAGKSNLLRSLKLLLDNEASQEIDQQHDWSRLDTSRKQPRETFIKAQLVNDENEEPISIIRKLTIPSEGEIISTLEVGDEKSSRSLTKSEKRQVPHLYYLRPRTGALQEEFDEDEENNIFTLVKHWMPSDLSKEGQLHKLMRKYAPKENNLMAYVKFFENELAEPLSIAFPSDLLTTLHPEYRDLKNRGKLLVREREDHESKRALFRLPLDHKGTGLISVVAMVLSVEVLREFHRQQKTPLLIAIEEPEVHLHPHAQRGFLEYLKWLSKRTQTIVTTHSPILVDRTQPENVVVIKRITRIEKSENFKKSSNYKLGATVAITDNDRNNWKDIIATLGIRLSDALMVADVNFLVEGESESIVIPAMVYVLDNSGEESLNIGRVLVVNGRGGNLPYWSGFLLATGNPTVVLLDKDGGGDNIEKKVNEEKVKYPHSELLIKYLEPPLGWDKDFAFEDTFDGELLLEAFNASFSGIPSFDFLPIKYEVFRDRQDQFRQKGEAYTWVRTIESLISDGTKKKNKKLDKRRLAEEVARRIRVGEMPTPPFYKKLFCEVNSMIKASS